MEGNRFDRLARAIADGGASRRQLLRLLVAATVGIGLGDRRPALAQSCNLAPNGFICNNPATPGGTCCPGDTFCCQLDSGNEICCGGSRRPFCDPTFTCRDTCPIGHATCGTYCCRPNERCDASTTTCVPCSTGQSPCPSGECVDFETDPANCGGCGFDCREIGMTICENGQCRKECTETLDCNVPTPTCQACVDGECRSVCGATDMCCLYTSDAGDLIAFCCAQGTRCCGEGSCCRSGAQGRRRRRRRRRRM
jgi:hypothetical protein